MKKASPLPLWPPRGIGEPLTASAVSVELSQRHAEVLRQNALAAGFPPESLHPRVQDAFAAVAQLVSVNAQFDLILADPPYGEKNVNRRSTSFAR